MGLVQNRFVSFRLCLNPDSVGDILGGSAASGGDTHENDHKQDFELHTGKAGIATPASALSSSQTSCDGLVSRSSGSRRI